MPRTEHMALTGDAASAVGILAWARDAGFDIAVITVGNVHVELHRASARGGDADDQDTDRAHRESLYDRFGGPALAAVVSEIPAGELQPVIGRTR